MTECRCNQGTAAAVAFVTIFVGAIVLVAVVMQEDKAKETERFFQWWQRTVVYHIYTPSFMDAGEGQEGMGDLKGRQAQVSGLRRTIALLFLIARAASTTSRKIGKLEERFFE